MITYQDFLNATDKPKWLGHAIAAYKRSEDYETAQAADEYEAQRNKTINEYVKLVYDITGVCAADPTASNTRIASNFFHRLNTGRCQYSLGNGISFAANETTGADDTKEALGDTFDTALSNAAYFALIHGDSYLFVNGANEYYVFPKTEFLPLHDEYTGKLRAGIRFWSLEWRKRPIRATLYEEDGYTEYVTANGKYGLGALEEMQPKRAYKLTVNVSEADGEEIIGGSNYGDLPIVPVYANKTKQSTLVGMRAKIDAHDLISSGFANDLQDCAQVYWLISNAMGMDENDIARLRDRLIYQHMAVVDNENSQISAHTQEIPYQARKECLDTLRNALYEDFGVLDVHTVAAGATNDHIDAGYQSMDQEADAFEYQIIQVVQQVLRLKGLDPAIPQFKRNKISNQKEQTEMVLLAAEYLDDKTLLNKLPFITVDEVEQILQNKDAEATSGLSTMEELQQTINDEQTGAD